MYNVIVQKRVYTRIHAFGLLYRKGFIDRFTDTGLGFVEDIIKQQYIQSAELMVDSIVDGIYTAASRDCIYHTPLDSGLRETSFRMGNRRVFLTYTEDDTTMTRYITDIEILRK